MPVKTIFSLKLVGQNMNELMFTNPPPHPTDGAGYNNITLQLMIFAKHLYSDTNTLILIHALTKYPATPTRDTI